MPFASTIEVSALSAGLHLNWIAQRPSLACAEIVRTKGLVFRPISLPKNNTIRWRKTGLLVTWIAEDHWRSRVNKPECSSTTKSLNRSLSRESREIHGALGAGISRTRSEIALAREMARSACCSIALRSDG